jgi:hypothetical protein
LLVVFKRRTTQIGVQGLGHIDFLDIEDGTRSGEGNRTMATATIMGTPSLWPSLGSRIMPLICAQTMILHPV